ncbi:MAG: amino acid adenylation domain-containing protein [Chitinophagales bacterium]
MDISVDNMHFPTSENIRYVHQLFASQVSEHPKAIALLSGNKELTYRDLDKFSETLANQLLSQSPKSRVLGISCTRSMEMIVGLLAILKAGKAYLPLDPSYPKDRLAEIILDSQIDTCLTADDEIGFFQSFGISVLPFVDSGSGKKLPDDLCPSLVYVLYTSGSTGKPKGVCMGHQAMVNLLQWQKKHSSAGRGTKTLQFTPLTFDVSFQEIFSTLCTGGTLVMIDDDHRLNPQALLNVIEDQQVNRIFLPFVALQFLTEAADASNYFPISLREVITAGEQLKITPQVIRFFSQLKDCRLFNQYGPTECHVVSELALEGDPASWPALPSIGKTIDNAKILILDDDLSLLPDGETGELCIGGLCVAEGYLNRPELDAEKFIQWKHTQLGNLRLYRTGDLARYRSDGNIEFLGRKDVQVKIRGYRIEPGEIEVMISNQEGIGQAVVVAREDVPGQKRLVAYLIPSGDKKDTPGLRKAMEKKLPDYMIPSAIVWLKEYPRTPSGKVDRKALPKPETKRPELSELYKAPASVLEKILSNLWSSFLEIDKVGVNDNFFELGGNSLLALKTVADLKKLHGYELPITKLYQFPTIRGISRSLEGKKALQGEKLKTSAANQDSHDVAVIAMAGRFPGADSIDQLWNLLKEGKESISFFKKEDLDPQISPELKNDPDYVLARGLISAPAEFDPAFFGINPKMAELMDPQQRIFLEISWEALEKAGYFPSSYSGSIAVFAGTGNNSYYLNNVLSNRQLVDRMGSFQVMTFNEKDYVASRTAYELDLKGPAVSIHSGCSTSLLAIAQAVECIREGRCDLALAGGASITSPVRSGHLYQEGAMLSRDGHCRPFDAQATGTLFSDGAGVVLLKRRAQAEKDGDNIFALIKGIGVNNDGGGKGSFTAPSAEGQAGAISSAIADAGIDPATISYVEAHGTATPLGDPIEIEGLKIAFGSPEKKHFCAIGSIKSNMGHLTAAAGVAGFIKTVLSMHNRQIPPSINFRKSNPVIDFDNSPFYVNDRLANWETNQKRRAGVSSFGVGGTNVHVILEEFPIAKEISGPGRPVHLFNWSAKSESSRETYVQSLHEFVQSNDQIDLSDFAFSLQTNREAFNARRFVIAADRKELLKNLSSSSINPVEKKLLRESAGELVFMFPGQGSQYVNMGRNLYQNEPVFRNAVDECARLLEKVMKEDIRRVIYPELHVPEADSRINNTYYTQPALFVIEYAMAKLWMSWGIQPMAFIGHSIGEFVAAHFAGVFSLEDALNLIATRGRLMSELPRGSMLGIRSGHEQIVPLLPEGLSLAAINSPALCVVAGPKELVDSFSKLLEEKSISNKILYTSHAFHSAMMDPILGPFEDLVRSMKLGIPRIPIMSTVTGNWLKDTEAVNPSYWALHLRSTVRFSQGITALLADPGRIFLETGPRNVAATLARQHVGAKPVISIASLEPNEEKSEYYSVLRALGQLWLQGVNPDWQAFYSGQKRVKLELPSYAFEKNQYWVEPSMQPTNGSDLNLSMSKQVFHIDSSSIPFEKEIPNQPKPMRKVSLIERLKEILENASGIDMEGVSGEMSFVEMGLDSLLLTQIALNFKKEFGIPISFRQLNEEFGNLELLATYLDKQLPADQPQTHFAQPLTGDSLSRIVSTPGTPASQDAIGLISQQIQLLAQQIAILHGNPSGPLIPSSAPKSVPAKKEKDADLTPEETAELKKPFGASAKIERQASTLDEKQKEFLNNLIRRYTAKTAKSKAYTQEHRAFMADPRVVSGFRPLTKEIVYSLVVNRSKGCRLWDLDGNEYIDALNGFGSNLLGYQPEVITRAIQDQIEKGYELGPQHELAGAVCKLICQFTGFDRSALCNTGSEAVLGALRIARTVTGRSKVVAFAGSYHGINDEVVVRGSKKLKSFPAAPGIMPESVQNMIILEYGTDQSLKIIREMASELAAILVEPVQSRRPEFQPVEFLRELRKISSASGSALIFDEVITGFRTHMRGAQGIFDIEADIGTYGKVIAGGMPIGVIAGKKQFMDALDGGYWQYGDQSVPEAGVTYFAGTFVRHPLALAASKASLEYMLAKGKELQDGLNKMTDYLSDSMNAICQSSGIPAYIAHFGSLWKIKFKEEIPYSELLFTLMRLKGVHIWDGFPCFISEAHDVENLNYIIYKFEESIDELVTAGFLSSSKPGSQDKEIHKIEEMPPIPGARLGRDKDGNPAWYITDPNRPGKFLQLN